MSIVLLANVGNHDLSLAKKELLPKQSDPYYYTPRRLGEEIRDNFKRYADAIALPLLEPTLNWLKNEEGHTLTDLRIGLFASDQDATITDKSDWLKDTYPVAEVIREYLNKEHQIRKANIKIYRMEGSPADYTNAMDFHYRTLRQVRTDFNLDAESQIYLEVSGGTPAMTSMLIAMGVEVFGQQAKTLYLDRSSERPYEIGIARALFARKTLENLRQQVRLYAYSTAHDTITHSGDLISSDERQRQALIHLLAYGDRRLAFDFERAKHELKQVQSILRGNDQARIKYWLSELNNPTTSIHIAELLHSMTVLVKLGQYAEITQRMFRFQESIFRYMAEQMGVQYGEKSNQYLSQSWLNKQIDLKAYLAIYPRQQDGILNPNKTIPIKTENTLNRYSLGALVDFYLQDAQWAHWRESATQIFRLSRVADLRNKGVAGHGFEGIGLEDIENAYAADVQTLTAQMTAVYCTIFANELMPNPYDQLNTMIAALTEPDA